jgi:hypothetical protein
VNPFTVGRVRATQPRLRIEARHDQAQTSISDGYVEDYEGNFDWAAPDGEVLAFVNDLERPIATYLYGRRLYETMVFWEGLNTDTDQPAVIRDFAEIWRASCSVAPCELAGCSLMRWERRLRGRRSCPHAGARPDRTRA